MPHETTLITGVGGFVGRHLAELLVKTGAVVCGTIYSDDEVSPDKPIPGVELMVCRLEDQSSVERVISQVQPSVVYHLAAQSSVTYSLANPVSTFRSNVMGTLHLLEELRKLSNLRAVILISSAEVYGIVPESKLPITEDTAFDPVNPYACSKACVDLLGAQYFRTFHLPVIRLRPFNHIGPGQSDAFVASDFAHQISDIEAGLRSPKLVVGNLDARRDFTDVRDIVRAYILAAEKCTPGEVYNICSGRSVSIREILDKLLSLTSVNVEVVQDAERMRPSDLPILVGDYSKFRAKTGWAPEIPLDQTLEDVLNYWRSTRQQQR
ncbi:MAG: GDP-mannose 4,6-dehydratase [Armatimonadota bacterium]|nr:GDP-mannose 4,6-dehydratase [Armatimonadota bacterium]